jgi:hypothetical protein
MSEEDRQASQTSSYQSSIVTQAHWTYGKSQQKAHNETIEELPHASNTQADNNEESSLCTNNEETYFNTSTDEEKVQ